MVTATPAVLCSSPPDRLVACSRAQHREQGHESTPLLGGPRTRLLGDIASAHALGSPPADSAAEQDTDSDREQTDRDGIPRHRRHDWLTPRTEARGGLMLRRRPLRPSDTPEKTLNVEPNTFLR